ncbi:K02A2.6-like [Cordylochernes scorpioides]|uniref:RNA-directed DNA polymerase n=1 Tax=Cordylochernes scorpioides TaxID=51811 RepID=A0ABY6L9C3_9ARAC|nr:K02A2.6-like [Cordylochernes scorpioides]
MAENPNNRLQKFNGSKSAIRPESWIKLYDFENNSLKEDEKIKNLMYYLTDSALEWYADEIISNPAIKRWEVVKEKLIQRFGSYNANPIVSASHRRLKREESIENYFQDKIRLLNQTHLTKEEKIHLLTDGLPNDWKDLIVAAQPTDATKWFHIAASIEQNRASIQFKPKNKIHLATKNNDSRKNVCPFWCPICSKKGIKIKHWVTDCEDYDPNYKKDRPNQNTSVKQVCGAPELLNVSTLTNTPTQGAFKLINISVEVNGIPAQAFVDTGATVSIINWRLFKRTRLQLQPNSDIHISQADGVTRTCGSLQTKVRIDKLIKPVTLHVMKNFKYPLLIGLDVASLFNLLIDVRDKTIYTKFDGLQNPILVNHLEEIREHELKELLEHYRNVFSQHAIDLGKVAIQHKIITKSEQPISLRPYRRPLKEYEEIAEQVKELLEHKLIRISDSPWAFPVVMVPKKDGNKRMCIDYRRLNEITLDDRQPLPHIQDMFDRLHGSRFFSTLDVAWGYWQIEMDPQSIQKTAFVTNDGHYEFLVMPFGLKNAASTFQRIIQHILGELLWKGTCSFQDDILVYTKTWQEHIELLSKVFDKLRQYNMKLKLSKCIFGRTEVKYLGHIISHNQLKPDPGKVKSIQDFPRPDTVKKVRQFMGLANYYRKFVKDFSKISFPLVRLTRKNQPFIWNEEVEESFAKLKMALSTKPVLAIHNPDYPSKVYTDASKYGIGAILTQIGPDNEEHVIAYYSKTLQPHQENYSAYEMECLAVIQATDHFHVYIENQPFEIITDHAALQWLFTMKKPKPKYFRWILSLSSKSCNIVHRSGKQQTHVDALSRLPVVNIATQELQEHQQNSDLSFLKNSHTHDGVVMIKQKGIFKAVVPNSLTKKILEEYHDSLSHPSITKTCKLITQCYWWKGITTDIKNYVRSCKSCQLVKVRHEPTLGEMITPTSNIQPLQMIGCDTIVLGTAAANTKHKFIQVFVDHATRYLWAYPTITNTAQAVTQCLDKIIKSVNSINTILTDNGKNFISKEFNKFLSLQGIKHTYTSPYHPQCNGICEKLNDTIMTKLRIAVLEKPRCKWSTLLPQVVKNYNSTPHDVTGFSPLFLMYGIGNVPEFADQTPITIEEARKKASLRTEQSRSKWKIKHDSHHPKYVFKEGDLVIRKIAFNDPRLIKTSPKYEGPFVIQKKISDVTYDISLKDQKQARRMEEQTEQSNESTGPSVPKQETTFEEEETSPPQGTSADPLTQIADALSKLLIARSPREIDVSPYHGTFEAQSFFDNFDAQADRAELTYTDRLRKLPCYLQEDYYQNKTVMGMKLNLPSDILIESLTEGLPVTDQRLIATVQPNTIKEWFDLVSRIRRTQCATSATYQRQVDKAPHPTYHNPPPRYNNQRSSRVTYQDNKGQQVEDMLTDLDLTPLNNENNTYLSESTGTESAIDITALNYNIAPTTQWKILKKNLEELCNEELNHRTIDKKLEKFSSNISKAAKVSIPRGKRHFLSGLMKDQPYDTIIQRIKLHLDPKKKVIPQRCRFLKRIQQEGESISEYLRELKHLAINCNFGDMLGTMMRDRFVAGIKLESLQKKLLQENDDVTLDKIKRVSTIIVWCSKGLSGKGEKEALAIIWACERFQDFLLGKRFRIETDHKPLIPLFSTKELSSLTPRLQRFRMRMMRFGFEIVHIPGKELLDADALSRQPLLTTEGGEDERLTSAHINAVLSCITDKDEMLTRIFVAQQEDTTLKAVVNYLEQGWPDKKKISQALLSYWHVKDELGVQNGLLMRGCRLVIPASMKLEILDKLHAGHFGITKTRLRARETVWWPGISEEIAETVRKCSVCIQEAVSRHEPLIPTKFPTRPWQRIGMDLFKFENKWYLVVIDYYSRFPEMVQLDRLTANVVVRSCKSIFARHGIPETVVSDNGTQFGTAREFANFAKQYGFTHITSSPRFPQSNGMAEAGVKIAKLILKKNQDPSLGLLEYRSTPLENGYSPAELLMGRKLRTTLPIAPENLNPRLVDSQNLKRKEERRRKDMKSRYDRRCGARDMEELSEGDTVWITDMRIWGIIKQKASTPRSYMVDTPVGTIRRNRFHLRKGDAVQYPDDPSTPTFSGGGGLVKNEKTPAVDYPSGDSDDGQIRTRNNRPLIQIFSPHKPIPICGSSRIKRWSLKLAAFNYTVEFRKTSDNSNVDALSRLPLESSVRESLDEDQVLLRKLNEVPFSFMEVAYETPQVLRNVIEGNWKFTRVCVPRENPLAPYYNINEELSLEFGCLQWRERVVISQKLIPLILNDLHEIHMGIVKMEMIARRYFLITEDSLSPVNSSKFTKMNGIRHTKTSPYNPSTNGLAERYVREFKNLLRKNNGKDDLETNLQRFLFAHRAFPQTVIKEFPRGTANKEKFKIKILEFNTKMGNPREVFHEAVRRQEQFTTGCEVYFRNYATGPKWKKEVPVVTSGNKEETASVHVPSCTPIPGPVAVHVPSCTPKPSLPLCKCPSAVLDLRVPGNPQTDWTLHKIDLDPEQLLYTPKIVDNAATAVIEMHGDI